MHDGIEPRVEGTVRVAEGRRLGFAEFGDPDGRAVVWMHGTPGARRQVPHDARQHAADNGLRLIGIDRPGIGSSTAHLYGSVSDFSQDLEIVADRLGIDQLAIIGLSGGGPYALGAARGLSDRVTAVGVLGGVAPAVGDDAIDGGVVALARRFSPLVAPLRIPLGIGLTGLLRLLRPAADQGIALYARLSPEGDRDLLNHPDFKTMFLDDLLNGSRKQLSAPLADLVLFSRHWGFDLAEVAAPVCWWHGDADNIVPIEHGIHTVDRLPDAELFTLEGQSHLGGLGVGPEVLKVLLDAADT